MSAINRDVFWQPFAVFDFPFEKPRPIIRRLECFCVSSMFSCKCMYRAPSSRLFMLQLRHLSVMWHRFQRMARSHRRRERRACRRIFCLLYIVGWGRQDQSLPLRWPAAHVHTHTPTHTEQKQPQVQTDTPHNIIRPNSHVTAERNRYYANGLFFFCPSDSTRFLWKHYSSSNINPNIKQCSNWCTKSLNLCAPINKRIGKAQACIPNAHTHTHTHKVVVTARLPTLSEHN